MDKERIIAIIDDVVTTARQAALVGSALKMQIEKDRPKLETEKDVTRFALVTLFEGTMAGMIDHTFTREELNDIVREAFENVLTFADTHQEEIKRIKEMS